MSPRSKEFYDRARERLEGAIAELRESADYDALVVEREQAERAIDSAERFLSALDELFGG